MPLANPTKEALEPIFNEDMAMQFVVDAVEPHYTSTVRLGCRLLLELVLLTLMSNNIPIHAYKHILPHVGRASAPSG